MWLADGDASALTPGGGKQTIVARGGLFNPRLKLVNVAPNESLRAKITTKKVSINKIFILLY